MIEELLKSNVSDGISHYVDNPDERPPGEGADGKPAETFNESKTRQLTFWKDLYADWECDPTLKIGVVCHSRGLALLQAWVDQGCPDDFDVDVKDINDPDDDPHATVYRWHKDEIKEVDLDSDDPLKPGIYPILHSLTDDDSDDGNEQLEKGGPGSGPHITGSGWLTTKGKFLPSPLYQHANTAISNELVSRNEKRPVFAAIENGHVRILNVDTPNQNYVGVEGHVNHVDQVKQALNSMVFPDDKKAYVSLEGGKNSKSYEGTIASAKIWLKTQIKKSESCLYLPPIDQAGYEAQMKFKGVPYQKSELCLYLPPLEVQRAAKSAYDLGSAVIGITDPLSDGTGLTEAGVLEVAKYFNAVESNSATEATVNAWGGIHAGKWAQRVIRKIQRDYKPWVGIKASDLIETS